MKSFYERWKDRGDEKSECQQFWNEILYEFEDITNPADYIKFEMPVELSHVSYIDAYIPSTGILIEQKSKHVNLDKPAKQSDGTFATPFEQAKRYYEWLPISQRGRYIIVSNFREIRIYDMEHPRDDPSVIMLENIDRENFGFLVKTGHEFNHEEAVSIRAGELVGKLYDALIKRYKNPKNPDSLRSLNILCVRLVFLLYAEDSGILDKSQFHDFLETRKTHVRTSLIQLFSALNVPEDERDLYLESDVNNFPYIDGGLFKEENIEIPKIDGDVLDILLNDMSETFNWNEINPTIFGALFESTLNPGTREEGGMHYTSIENIHKVIDPLFMNDLNSEFDKIMSRPAGNLRTKKLLEFQNKLASITFLDPACGSGNFLTETYLSLRRLENRIIEELSHGQINFAEGNLSPIKISISHFYGIEINDFAVSVARTALWIAEHQMIKKTRKLVEFHDDYIPLKTYNNIIEANAIRTDWAKIISPRKLNYIISNPPFRGARIMQQYQKKDIADIFTGWGSLGNFDYVCCWYKKAFDFMKGTKIKAALLSTNSINQGELVSIFWKPLLEGGMNIDFAYKPFIWDSESKDKAHVHCVIIGFSMKKDTQEKFIYEVESNEIKLIPVTRINAYLLDAPDWYIYRRKKPICQEIPEMRIGNKPVDDGNYLFTPEEYKNFIRAEPKSKKYFHLWYGGQEFLHDTPRYCLYLGECKPHEIKTMPMCKKRVEAVRSFRLASESIPTRKIADNPTKFHVTTMPKGNYIVIPKTSSSKRFYIPIGFLDDSVLCGDALMVIPEAGIYHFGILASVIHMAWTKIICGRLGMGYRYSSELVYNNFVWPSVNESQRKKIELTAQNILDARKKHPESSLSDLYDDSIMPEELRKAHYENDWAVLEAYGFNHYANETEIVTRLMSMHSELEKK